MCGIVGILGREPVANECAECEKAPTWLKRARAAQVKSGEAG